MASAASSSSLTSTVPQFHWTSSNATLRRPTRRRSSAVSLPASAAFTASRPSLRSTRPQALCPVLYRRPSVINGGIKRTGINDSSSRCLCCFRDNLRGSSTNFTRFKTAAFSHNSPFPLRTHRLFGHTTSVKRGRVLCAKQGPDEPHVASQTWSETSLDKPSYLDDVSESEINVNDLLNFPLPSHPKLHRGQLQNGLQYIILPNSNPSGRFEAHMEVHVGSIDEEEHEQGIAHMIEHVTFLGSKKREKLLSTGSKSNAYTDFHHTVFHIHSLTHNKETGEGLLPSVLDALNEIAFHPEFLPSRIEKERKAILSELQMMNTIEYRIDCQLLQHLHSENKLSKRFPIGLEEQIKKWDPDTIRKFHEKWYYPCNATLYLVGDISNIPNVINQIEQTFSNKDDATSSSPSSSSSSPLNFLVNKFTNGFAKTEQARSVDVKIEREDVKHEWSLPNSNRDVKPPQIFQHELIPTFSFNMFAKVPVDKVTTYRDLRDVLIKRIFLSALQFRINNRYMSSNPPFTSVELDHSDSGREKCTVTTLHVSAEPKNWQKAVKLAVHEVRRLKEFGVTKGEMTRYMDAIIKDSEQFASMSDNIPSEDILNFIMETDSLNHTIMDQQQNYESLLAISETITLEEVNSIGQQILEFISDFGQPNAPIPTAIVACVPRKIHKDGEKGDFEFVISENEIVNAIKEGLEEPIFPEPELEVPEELITEAQLEELKAKCESSFVELINGKKDSLKLFDKETGIVQRRLSNGISVNYKMTEFEKNIGVMRLIVCGGRATEIKDSKGSVIVGVRALSESGSVGNFSREQIGLFCMNNAITCSLDCTEECIFMEFRFSLRDNGMRAAFQLLHMLLEENLWVEDAFERARQLYLSYYRSINKSLERSVAYKLMKAMLNGDERFVEPSIESLQNLSLEKVKNSVMSHFVGDNMELSIVGDFKEDEIESCILDYIGTVKAEKSMKKENEFVVEPFVFREYPSDLHFQNVSVKDTDERACAYLAGPAPNRWGFTYDGKDLFEFIDVLDLEDSNESSSLNVNIRKHPLFFGVTLGLLAEIINSRLFTTVRDSLGLTYDVSFQVNPFDSIKLGFYVVSVTSTPEKVEKAVDACKSVLRSVKHSKITQRELDRAKRTLLMKHMQDSESNNVYWLSLMAHLQANSVPRKDVSCIRDLSALYEGASIDDVYLAYDHLGVDESSLFACIGISGNKNNDSQSDDDDHDPSGDGHHGMLPTGRGSSTMTRPTT